MLNIFTDSVLYIKEFTYVCKQINIRAIFIDWLPINVNIVRYKSHEKHFQ